jgi:YbgC/YbaW family acyl-CoA thioester hydrolase
MEPSTSPVLTARLRIRTYELDSFGHVNNAAYLNYLEEARSEFLKQMGLSFHDFARYGVQLVIIEAHVYYKSPARYGDEIEVSATFRDVRPVSAFIDYTLTEIASGRLIATATTKGAFVDASTGRPVRAPEAFRHAFETFSTAPAS